MPAVVVDEPLGIVCTFSDGRQAAFTLAARLRTALARDLLAGLAGMVHPHGAVDSAKTVDHHMTALRDMTRALAAAGFTGGAAGLSRARLGEYWMGASYARETATRQMLASVDAATGCLHPAARELLAGRAYHQPRPTTPLPPYSDGEWSRLITTCRRLNLGGVHRSHDGVGRRGPRSRPPRGRVDAGERAVAGRSPPGRPGRTWGQRLDGAARPGRPARRPAELFPESDVTLAYRLLFGAFSGIVPDGIDALGLADIDWAGDASVLLSYVKRRTAAESLALPGPAVRLLARWLEHSALLRRLAPPTLRGELWLRYCPNSPVLMRAGKFEPVTVNRWVARHGLLDDDGRPLQVRLDRIRTTFQARRDRRSWNGSTRATIDPNHSPRVEGDRYLTAASTAQRDAIDEIIADAQADMLRRAHPPAVLTDTETASLARDFPQLAAPLGLDDAALAELAGGQRDVFTAACADPLAGLHGPKGQPCPARPWVCPLCPLAIFTPRHAANLLRLKAFFARQWRQMPAAQFMAVFGPYAQRIEEILPRFAAPVLAEAARHVADTDAEVPDLRPEEATT